MKKFAKQSIQVGLSYVIPSVLGIFCIPALYHILDPEAFSSLSITWVILAYLSFIDFGIGRAITLLISRVRKREYIQKMTIIEGWYANGIVITIVTSFLLAAISTKIFGVYLSEVFEVFLPHSTMFMFFIAVLLGIFNSFFRGYQEGLNKFGASSFNRLIVGSLTVLFPVLTFFTEIIDVISLAIIGNFISKIVSFSIFTKKSPSVKIKHIRIYRLKKLFSVGTWFGVSNVVGPVMVSGDRFLAAPLLGVGALSGYIFIQEILSRILILPTSISSVLFPKAAGKNNSVNFFNLTAVLVLTVCVSFLLVYLSSIHISYLSVIQDYLAVFFIVCIGIFFNTFAQIIIVKVQHALLQQYIAIGHCLQFVAFCALIFLFVPAYGVIALAYIWSLRCMFDLFWIIFLESKIKEI